MNVDAATQPRRSDAGFWSSARAFFLPVGPAIDPAGVAGYPIDMRVKAKVATWPPRPLPPRGVLHAWTAQFGLGCYERWLSGESDSWLRAARDVGEHLVAIQEPDGSWMHGFPYPHTFPVSPPWASSLAQGEGASLLVRLHLETGAPELAVAARKAVQPLMRATQDGGLNAVLDGRPWPEEYPTDPPSYVLNGAMFALWGLRDVAIGLDDLEAAQAFKAGVDSIAANLHKYDLGYWSLYSLYPHPAPNVCSSFYHALHVSQLQAMFVLSPRPTLAEMGERWAGYARSPRCRRRAFAAKAAFRLLVPRNRWLAHRMPRGRPA